MAADFWVAARLRDGYEEFRLPLDRAKIRPQFVCSSVRHEFPSIFRYSLIEFHLPDLHTDHKGSLSIKCKVLTIDNHSFGLTREKEDFAA